MALDRDLAVAFATATGRTGARGWELTAATGVRGLRLLGESGAFASFAFSESSPRSFEVLARNVASFPGASARLEDGGHEPPTEGFDYVDLDPYGSPLPLLAAALGATRTGGLLGVTATDMPVLAGAQPAACRRLYGAEPVRGRLGPEGALRILLATLADRAGASGRGIRPLLGYVGGHHVRAYVELLPDPVLPPPVGTIDPDRWDGPGLSGRGPFGPLWLGPIVEPSLVRRLSVPPGAARPRELERFLRLLRDDAEVERPFYYEANTLAEQLGLERPAPLGDLLAAVRAGGWRAGRTHVRPEGFRTDAPRSVVEGIARAAALR